MSTNINGTNKFINETNSSILSTSLTPTPTPAPNVTLTIAPVIINDTSITNNTNSTYKANTSMNNSNDNNNTLTIILILGIFVCCCIIFGIIIFWIKRGKKLLKLNKENQDNNTNNIDNHEIKNDNTLSPNHIYTPIQNNNNNNGSDNNNNNNNNIVTPTTYENKTPIIQTPKDNILIESNDFYGMQTPSELKEETNNNKNSNTKDTKVISLFKKTKNKIINIFSIKNNKLKEKNVSLETPIHNTTNNSITNTNNNNNNSIIDDNNNNNDINDIETNSLSFISKTSDILPILETSKMSMEGSIMTTSPLLYKNSNDLMESPAILEYSNHHSNFGTPSINNPILSPPLSIKIVSYTKNKLNTKESFILPDTESTHSFLNDKKMLPIPIPRPLPIFKIPLLKVKIVNISDRTTYIKQNEIDLYKISPSERESSLSFIYNGTNNQIK